MNTLYCVHIAGPDEIHAAESKEAAEKSCEELNAFAKKMLKANNWEGSDSPASVIEWPYDTESHAQSLLKQNASRIEFEYVNGGGSDE